MPKSKCNRGSWDALNNENEHPADALVIFLLFSMAIPADSLYYKAEWLEPVHLNHAAAHTSEVNSNTYTYGTMDARMMFRWNFMPCEPFPDEGPISVKPEDYAAVDEQIRKMPVWEYVAGTAERAHLTAQEMAAALRTLMTALFKHFKTFPVVFPIPKALGAAPLWSDIVRCEK